MWFPFEVFFCLFSQEMIYDWKRDYLYLFHFNASFVAAEKDIQRLKAWDPHALIHRSTGLGEDILSDGHNSCSADPISSLLFTPISMSTAMSLIEWPNAKPYDKNLQFPFIILINLNLFFFGVFSEPSAQQYETSLNLIF